MIREIACGLKTKYGDIWRTYICPRDTAKPYAFTILDDWVAGRTQINVYIFAIVHAELATIYDDNAIPNTRDVCGSINCTTKKETVRCVFYRQTRVWFAVCCGNRHVDDAALD